VRLLCAYCCVRVRHAPAVSSAGLARAADRSPATCRMRRRVAWRAVRLARAGRQGNDPASHPPPRIASLVILVTRTLSLQAPGLLAPEPLLSLDRLACVTLGKHVPAFAPLNALSDPDLPAHQCVGLSTTGEFNAAESVGLCAQSTEQLSAWLFALSAWCARTRECVRDEAPVFGQPQVRTLPRLTEAAALFWRQP
jgi:hypothetical protein